MSLKLTSQTFRHLLDRSGLLTDRQRAQVTAALATLPQVTATATGTSDWLVQAGFLTRWQADKLLQARHRGFFLGEYKLRRKIARGGMSSIYLAEHRDTGNDVVLKVLPLDRVDRESYLPRFQREAEVAVRLQHPNIVRVYGVHQESDGSNDIHFMTMEFLEGADLYDIVCGEGPFSFREAADYIRQAARGLHFAHKAGLVHRDVKPGNLFLTSDGVVKLLDLGLAHDFASEENLTREYNERVLGTADYLPPEQAVDSHRIDARADIYALGCTMWFLLTGSPPFPDGSLAQRIIAHQTRPPERLTQTRPDAPEVLDRLLTRMMQKRPEDRPQSAKDVAEELSRWLEAPTSEATAAARSEHVKPSASRQRLRGHAAGEGDNAPSTDASTDLPGRSRTPTIRGDARPAPQPPSPDDTDSAAADRILQPEFVEFLLHLEQSQHVNTVFQPEARAVLMQRMASSLPADVAAADFPDPSTTPDQPNSDAMPPRSQTNEFAASDSSDHQWSLRRLWLPALLTIIATWAAIHWLDWL
jgi:serine/threonine protein kinase